MRGVVATGEFSISDVAWVEECLRQLCKRRVGLLCSCLHGDLRSDGAILLLDREVRRNVRWRGSDTRSWGRSRIPGRRLFFFPQWPVGRGLQTGAFGGGKGRK
jgi:hypothetical protein